MSIRPRECKNHQKLMLKIARKDLHKMYDFLANIPHFIRNYLLPTLFFSSLKICHKTFFSNFGDPSHHSQSLYSLHIVTFHSQYVWYVGNKIIGRLLSVKWHD